MSNGAFGTCALLGRLKKRLLLPTGGDLASRSPYCLTFATVIIVWLP